MNAKRLYLFFLLTITCCNFHVLDAQVSSTDSILRFWLQPKAVNNNKPVFNTFYFWTTLQELDTVEQQKRLLRTTVSDVWMEQKYVQNLMKIAGDDEPIRHHLMSGERQRIRASWPCYWTDLLYQSDSSRENQLVQVVLKDSALIVTFSPEERPKKRWRIFDLRGNEIDMQTALNRKRHIAAVYMMGEYTFRFPGPRTAKYPVYFRSFILCNEEMIMSWHHAVPGMQARILNDIDYLLLLNAWFTDQNTTQEQGKKGKNCRTAWYGVTMQTSVAGHFFATMSYAGELEPFASASSAKKIITRLRMYWHLQKNPVERYPAAER